VAIGRGSVLFVGLAVFALAPLSSCVLSQTTEGTKLSQTQVAQIAVGRSTRADVERVLGAPDKIIYSNREHDPLYERAYQYHREKRKTTYFTLILFSASRSDSNSDNVIVFFDDQGVVEDVGMRLDMNQPRYGVPWGHDDN
jgi:outer membrane protein assembly factor BamE (lipoprotein component of BamABCDE complex)